MTNRQIAAAETRKRLIEAARDIICSKGLTNTTIEEITEKSGVSKGTFYTYFKRKEDIVYELSETMFDKILNDAKTSEGDILNRLKGYMISFSSYIELSSVKLAQEWIKNVADSDISDAGTKKLSKDTAAVINLLQNGIENGELASDAPIGQLSHTINDLLYGQLLCWAISGGEYSFEERTREFCGMYLNKIMEQYLI